MATLQAEVQQLRLQLMKLSKRVTLDAVAEAFIASDHSVQEGDCFLLHGEFPTRLSSVSGDGKWTYFDGRNSVEPFRIPSPTEYPRLYTIEEVAAIVSKAVRPYIDPAPLAPPQ